MDKQFQEVQPNLCLKHNQPILLCDSDLQSQLYCLICMQEKTGTILYEQFNKQKQDIIKRGIEESDDQRQQFQLILDSILNFKNTLLNCLDKIIQAIIDQIKNIQQQQEQLRAFKDQLKSINEINKVLKHTNQQCEDVKSYLREQLQDLQYKYLNYNQLLVIFDQPTKIINESRTKEGNVCFAFAFNKNNSILIVGSYSAIIVYQFFNGQIVKELQRLQSHSFHVCCLCFMNKSNGFISGSRDSTIIIWNYDKNNQWSEYQTLKNHEDDVNCIIVNQDENILFSNSADESIKIWIKENENWRCSQSINTNSPMHAISLNQLESKLIACGIRPFILIITKQADKLWALSQTIYLREGGYRLGFTVGDQFVFLPETQNYLEIYNYDIRKKEFYKQNEVMVESCEDDYSFFPCQYIKELQILSVKHGQFLFILQRNKEGNYQIIQTIQFEHYWLNGRMTDDGNFLITWDYENKEIQVRKLKFRE